MTNFEIVMRLTSVAVLSSYLYLKHRERMRRRLQGCNPAEWTGKPIDVANLKPTVEEVRHDYLAGRQSTRGRLFHRRLLELARRAVTRLEYFQDKESHEHAHEHSR